MDRFLSVLLVLSLFAPSTASAAVPDSPARQAFEEGRRAYNLGQFQEAIAAFEQSYRLSGDPMLLFDVAQAHRQAGHLEQALIAYRAYLRERPTATNRPYVEGKIADLQSRASAARIARSGAAEPGPPTGSRLPTDISDPFTRRDPAVAPARPLPGWLPWAGAAATGLLLAGAVVTTASVRSRHQELEKGCAPPLGPGCSDAEVDSLEARANLRNLLWAAGAALGVATGVAFYLNASPGRADVALAVRF